MRIIIQRCSKAKVEVDGKCVGAIGKGLLLLVGFTEGDSESEIDYLVHKILHLRIFDDDEGIMNKSLLDVSGEILTVSQFTLYADCRKGNRPSYYEALSGDKASILYEKFNKKLSSNNVVVETGVFGAMMQVVFVNDGPVTIMLERKNENG